jgi:predicted amidohydrolase
MQDLMIATAQFEHRDNDKAYNLGRVRELTRSAVEQGAQIVCFHEGCIPAYSWVQPLSKAEMAAIAEPVPDGPSVAALIQIARQFKTIVMAGLFEIDGDELFNTYVVVGPDGFITSFRKLHPFVNAYLSPGNAYNVIELLGWKIGILICYDNNLPENPLITALMGAQVIIAPHVTCCLPSNMPGRGVVERSMWENRQHNPVALRQEFQGPKGRGWLMRWLPARAYENGVYYVFSNPIGWDYDTVKPGLAMILDPFGEVLIESHALEDDVVVGRLTPDKLGDNSGQRFRDARRPELYARLLEPQDSVTDPGWKLQR